MLWTWQNGDIASTPGFDGNFEQALAAIKAKAIAMPAVMDLYLHPEGNEYEVKFMPNAELHVISSVNIRAESARVLWSSFTEYPA